MDLVNKTTCDHRIGNPVQQYLLSNCPRCLSRGWYGGFCILPSGNYQTVTGQKLLNQKIEKILYENKRPSGYGFDYSLLTGIIDAGRLDAIKGEIVRCIDYLSTLQANNISKGFSYTPSEILAKLETVNVIQNTNDPRQVDVVVEVSAKSRTQSTVSMTLRR